MEHTGLPHDHGEEQNHTAAMRELLRDEGHFQRIADISASWATPAASVFSGCCATARSVW